LTELTLDQEEKLDRVVARALGVSRRIARIMIGEGAVEVNGKPWKIVAKPVRAGAVVRITREAPPEAGADQGPSLDDDAVLYIDPSIIVIDKPSGLLSETDRVGSASLQTLVPQLLTRRGERSRDIWLVHRLDAGTSGVIVLARSAQAARALDAVFREARASKEYLALANGRLPEPRAVDAAIGRAQGTRHKVDPAGKPAFTQLTPLRTGTSATLVECKPRTGRTHQIRVHLAHVGHPIFGDRLYGGPAYTASTPPRAVGRVMLHARALTVPHPKTGKASRFEALLPKDFVALGEALGVIDAL
jgi:23S rRNA pseudouridine1911/1915/1917 synthase